MQIPDAAFLLLRQIQAKLQLHSLTVTTAESCTGGLLAYLLTELPGSSATYLGGVSAYSNEVKSSCLGVPAALIDTHGAVSAPVAEAMAKGALGRLGSDFAVSLTGVAGPGGGTKLKPVGTVFCGLARRQGVQVYPLALSGDRHQVRWAAAMAGLGFLRDELAKISD